MTAKIFEYEDGQIFITPECLMIPEVKAIFDKFGKDDCKPYLAFVHLMSWINSPYRNYDNEEKKDLIVFDVLNTVGEFDPEEPLIEPCIKKLVEMNTTPLTSFFTDVEQELHRMRKYLANNEISAENVDTRFRILKEAGSITASYNKTKAAAEEEVKIKGRGKAQIGDY